MRKIKVLVVDDSMLFRNLLVQSLSEDPYIEVVAQAGDAYAARDAILKIGRASCRERVCQYV